MTVVYLAGPYSKPDPIDNIRKALDEADRLTARYYVHVFVPHLTGFWHFHRPRPYQQWLDYDLAILARCDVLYLMPGESPGADGEVAHAEACGIPVATNDKELEAVL